MVEDAPSNSTSIQAQILDELKKQSRTKKDLWDRFSTVSTFVSTVVIAGLGLYFTQVYSERQSARAHQDQLYQTRILEMQTVEKFIPHLTGDEERKKVALLALTSLGSPEFATRFAQLNPSKGTESAADVIMATASSAEGQQAPVPVLSVPSTTSGTSKTGWAYIGQYVRDTKQWRTWYFEFKDNTIPESLRNQVLEVRGSLNVRDGMPTPDGQFPRIVDVLKPGSKATVQEIREWQSVGYMWARIEYGR